jgi:hypothetical protein
MVGGMPVAWHRRFQLPLDFNGMAAQTVSTVSVIFEELRVIFFAHNVTTKSVHSVFH